MGWFNKKANKLKKAPPALKKVKANVPRIEGVYKNRELTGYKIKYLAYEKGRAVAKESEAVDYKTILTIKESIEKERQCLD